MAGRTYDLFADRTVSIETYERRMRFSVTAPEFEGRVYMSIGDTVLEPRGGIPYPTGNTGEFSWNKPGDLNGRVGYYNSLSVTFEETNGRSASHSLRLQITPGHLEVDELETLLNDMVYLLFLDWEAPATVGFVAAAGTGKVMPKLVTWHLIQERAPDLLSAAHEIARHPRLGLARTYHEAQFRVGARLDARSIRWLAQHGLSPDKISSSYDEVLLPHNVPSGDIPENRFVLLMLRRVSQLLETLEPAIAGQLEEESQRRVETIARNRVPHRDLRSIEAKIDQLQEYQEEREQLQFSFQTAARHPFFQTIDLDEVTFMPPENSLILTQEPSYFQYFDFYHRTMGKAEPDWLSRADGLTRRLAKVGADRISSIYENWCFVRVYHELQKIGFNTREGHDLPDLIVGDRLNPRLVSGNTQWIEMFRDMGSGRHVRLQLFHEREFWGDKGIPRSKEFAWKPDITIEIWTGTTKAGLLFLDAKYMDFHKRDKRFHGLEHLRQELYESTPDKGDGVKKYLRIPHALASFILHPTTHPHFENYGAQVPRNVSAFSLDDTEPGNHRLGYIPFRPASTTSFRKLMGMIFVLKLGLEHYCWNCHSSDVKTGHRPTKRYCPDCGTTWWLNHCGTCSEHPTIIKGEEVPFQVAVAVGNYRCPRCGQAGKF